MNQRMLANQSTTLLYLLEENFIIFPCKFPHDFFLNGLRGIKVNIVSNPVGALATSLMLHTIGIKVNIVSNL